MEEEKVYKTKFKQYCVENHLRAADVADEVGCSVKSIYAYMQGYRLPNRRTMKVMERKLGIDTREIFD